MKRSTFIIVAALGVVVMAAAFCIESATGPTRTVIWVDSQWTGTTLDDQEVAIEIGFARNGRVYWRLEQPEGDDDERTDGPIPDDGTIPEAQVEGSRPFRHDRYGSDRDFPLD